MRYSNAIQYILFNKAIQYTAFNIVNSDNTNFNNAGSKMNINYEKFQKIINERYTGLGEEICETLKQCEVTSPYIKVDDKNLIKDVLRSINLRKNSIRIDKEGDSWKVYIIGEKECIIS